MSSKIITRDGYAVLKAYPIMDSVMVVTENCPFCNLCHVHVNPLHRAENSTTLRKSHCLNKSLTLISTSGFSVGNHIYHLEVQHDEYREPEKQS